MNPFEMVVLIVAITAAASIFRARYQRREADSTASPEADRLREEVRALKERVAVLERIALEREIDALRTRD